ncbi:hypothetical protein AM571_PC01336 (plasmid) [Rhizobium etli 8C-3]|uniref:Uncharacterized protein n=1 Tax=Rhizobium etli 8C-3 TaxID=538025 RepID=A0A1L5PFV1_RHIET|nr:hypothetical protein AM571_PC01336 [Rhizobium etli 8C-3]
MEPAATAAVPAAAIEVLEVTTRTLMKPAIMAAQLIPIAELSPGPIDGKMIRCPLTKLLIAAWCGPGFRPVLDRLCCLWPV